MLLVEGQVSNLGSYEATGEPTIASVFPASAATQGGIRMTIIGANFGADGGTVILQGRDIPIPAGPDWTASEIQFDLPEGDPGPAPIRVLTTSGSVTPFHDGFGYDPAVVFSSSPPIVPSMGGVVITIFGENFGTAGATPRGAHGREDLAVQPAQPHRARGHDPGASSRDAGAARDRDQRHRGAADPGRRRGPDDRARRPAGGPDRGRRADHDLRLELRRRARRPRAARAGRPRIPRAGSNAWVRARSRACCPKAQVQRSW